MLTFFEDGITNICDSFNISEFGQIQELNSPNPIFICGNASSSLDLARYFAGEDKFDIWSSVICLQQTSGRGQLGRQWYSPKGNLFAAIRLPMTAPFDGIEAATAFSALLCEVLNELNFEIQIKFPNDLVRQIDGIYYKVGGILLEERNNKLFAGIGINLVKSPDIEHLREDHAMPANIFCDDKNLNAINLWQKILPILTLYYNQKICHSIGSWKFLARKYLINNKDLNFNED